MRFITTVKLADRSWTNSPRLLITPDARCDKFCISVYFSDRLVGNRRPLINISTVEEKKEKEIESGAFIKSVGSFHRSRINVRKWIGVKKIKGISEDPLAVFDAARPN